MRDLQQTSEFSKLDGRPWTMVDRPWSLLPFHDITPPRG